MNSREVELTNDMARLRDLRRETRNLEASISDRQQPWTYADETKLLEIRARADPIYKQAGRLGAPEPMMGVSPHEYRTEIIADLARYHPQWSDKNLSRQDFSSIREENALSAIESQVFEAARKNGPSYGLKPGQLKEIDRTIDSKLHKVTEYAGGPGAWFGNYFRREPARVILKDKRVRTGL